MFFRVQNKKPQTRACGGTTE